MVENKCYSTPLSSRIRRRREQKVHMVISIEEAGKPTLGAATITLVETTSLETKVDTVLTLLADNRVIPEYCI